MPNPQSQGSPFDDLRSSFNTIIMVAWAVATPLETVLHRNIGSRYLGFNALGGLLFIVLFTALCGPEGSGALLLFGLLYLIMCGAARIAAIRRSRRGDWVHSYASGDPRLCRLLPRVQPINIKRFIEPLGVLDLGLALSDALPALGGYLTAAAISLIAMQELRCYADRTRLINMRDAHIAGRHSMEQFRRVIDNRHNV